jgi:hypothetical protein
MLTELMVFAVPAFFADSAPVFDPSAKRKRFGALRSELSLHGAYFVRKKAKADTAAVRSMAVAYALLVYATSSMAALTALCSQR